MAIEASLSVPKISACGFFDIDLTVVSSVVGTMLTYLLILCQFETSEKWRNLYVAFLFLIDSYLAITSIGYKMK